MSTPAVSVVMAAYEGAALIADTLASLSNQTMADFEVLVVDDGSSDGTRAIVAGWPDPRVRLIALDRNGGPVLARNRGVAEARGRHIAALDQDDLCHPTRLERQLECLDANPDLVLVGSATDVLRGNRRLRSGHAAITTPHLMGWLIQIENPYVWSSIMVRGDAARRLDPFTRPEILYAEDFDLYHRLDRMGAIARLDEPLLTYRHHPGGASKRHARTMAQSAMRVLAERHRPTLGNDAPIAARLLFDHVMDGLPAPDRATFRRLGETIEVLQARYLSEVRPGGDDVRLIRWETALRWARVGRASLRAGTLSFRDVLATRPPHLGLGYAGLDALMWDGFVGGARRRSQTLSAKIMRPLPNRSNT